MRSLRYLNTVLTVIAILLTLQLWTTWSAGSASWPGASVAQAKAKARSQAAARASGIPNAGAQRAETVNQLRKLNQNTETLIGLFRNGKARVRVEGELARDRKRNR